jgi:hypothetical protein
MGSTACSGCLSLPLDVNIFQQGSYPVNPDKLESNEEFICSIMSFCKPDLVSPTLTFIIATDRSRVPLELSSLKKLLKSKTPVTISARESGKLTVVVDYLNEGRFIGETTMFEVPDENVSTLISKLNTKFRTRDTVLYTNSMLLEGNLTLAECGILEDVRLFFMPKSEPTITLSLNCPKINAWRILKSGMNLEGQCKNSACPAYSQRVVIPLGFGTFNIAEEMLSNYECPICNEVIGQFSNLGFFNCSANFDSQSEQSIRADGIECSSHSYTKTKVEKWRSAVVTVRPRKLRDGLTKRT